jgi:intracellular septation protein
MNALLDFIPLLAFYAAYKAYGVYVATAVLMGATLAQVIYLHRKEGRVSKMHRLTLALVWGFGAMTLIFHNERFIQFKPTVLYSLMTVGLALYWKMKKRSPLAELLGDRLHLPPKAWKRLTWAWLVYLPSMAALNAFVAYSYSLETWFAFKLWGYAFPVIFLIGQGIYIARSGGLDARAQ